MCEVAEGVSESVRGWWGNEVFFSSAAGKHASPSASSILPSIHRRTRERESASAAAAEPRREKGELPSTSFTAEEEEEGKKIPKLSGWPTEEGGREERRGGAL